MAASFLTHLLEGGSDYRVSPDLGGAVFAPISDAEEDLQRFQSVAERIKENDGHGYTVVHRLTHHTSGYRQDYIDRMVINTHR